MEQLPKPGDGIISGDIFTASYRLFLIPYHRGKVFCIHNLFTVRYSPVCVQTSKTSAAILVAVGDNPYSPLLQPQTSHTQNPPIPRVDNRPDPFLAPDAYQPGQNLQEWLIELSLLLADVPLTNHTRYMLRFLSPPTRKLAFTAGININTPFPTATALLSTFFDNQLSPGTANQCFANLRQKRNQSVNDFARELGRLASLAFLTLPQVNRDELIIHHFVTGLLDRTTTQIFVLHPPPSLAAVIRQCKRYDDFQTHADIPNIPSQASNTLPDVPARQKRQLPVRFPNYRPGCQYCAAFGSGARRCGHNSNCRDLRLPSDLTHPLQTADQMLTTEYGTRLRQVIRQAHNAARSLLQTAATHQKKNHDHTCSGQTFQTGDLVLHFNTVPPRGTAYNNGSAAQRNLQTFQQEPLAHFGDPALTMRVRVCTREGDSARVIIDASQPDLVLVLFQSFLFILSCTDSANVYTFRIRLLLTNLRVSVLRDNDKVLMIQWPGHHETAAEEQLLISCPDQSTRDLLNATLSDLIESTLNKVTPSPSSRAPHCRVAAVAQSLVCSLVFQASTARPAGGASASRLQQQSVAESAPGAAIAPTTVAPVTQQIATTPSSSASSSTDKKPPPEKRTTSLHRSESSRSVGGELKSSTSGDATAAAVRPVSSGPPVSSPTHNHQHPCAAPPFTTTVAVTDVSGLPGCRFLSHSATLQAHVKWPDDIISLPSRMRSAAKGHLGPRAAVSPVQNSNSSHVLRSLRLDAASPWASLPQQQHADRLGAASAAVANSTAVVAAVDMAVGGRVSRASQQQQRSSRPGSPKPSTAAATVSAASSNIMRRRRSDELNMRAEWDSMILQVVDAYRCSFWQEMSPKPVDLAKLRLSVAELRQKESSLPPDPSRGQQRAATVAHCYENAPPEGFKLTTGEASEPIRPPPVVLPTRGERRT
ncbi:unnamed protein product [Schistocephalus solidus]|uniref:Retrotransposon gag domain-containing protein n=1 Tax=Schistocephalus solidus TaxID=70667 RepID=A0A183SRE0_SCHSO|nr:unnamed protein product [Schistocephalus solidus]